jgi:hypothetical protein
MKNTTATYEVVLVLFVRADVGAVKVRQRPGPERGGCPILMIVFAALRHATSETQSG